ncbi:hypothetical protein B0I21_101527 [Sphingobacterium paludis]|uniref:Uncharacterized protein n=1 Tax=Sphingobacterium paludis TaxID=1476465 RepID=A0A4R7DEP6_9SPHI|nr:hypothetical protein B0I21_101527 [Sphingobacterium paludis]
MTLISCTSRLEFTYNDAVRNQLTYFFEPNNESMRFYHDIENSEISGYFTPINKLNYFMNADSLAMRENWKKIVNDSDKKIYIQDLGNGDYSICTLHSTGNMVHLRILTL